MGGCGWGGGAFLLRINYTYFDMYEGLYGVLSNF